jgi:hypothetical protein
MPYSKEFIDWTGAQGIEPDFEIRLVSGNMTDGMSSDVQCDGLHFVGMYKRSDGMLLLKMKSSNEEGFQYQTFLDVKRVYVPNQPTPVF